MNNLVLNEQKEIFSCIQDGTYQSLKKLAPTTGVHRLFEILSLGYYKSSIDFEKVAYKVHLYFQSDTKTIYTEKRSELSVFKIKLGELNRNSLNFDLTPAIKRIDEFKPTTPSQQPPKGRYFREVDGKNVESSTPFRRTTPAKNQESRNAEQVATARPYDANRMIAENVLINMSGRREETMEEGVLPAINQVENDARFGPILPGTKVTHHSNDFRPDEYEAPCRGMVKVVKDNRSKINLLQRQHALVTGRGQ